MPSSYSQDLRIQLIGPGEQAGTWGSTTNNNFQYILEQAIAGWQQVSITSANQVLTYLNGATSTPSLNQSIYAMLQLSGASVNFNVFTPNGSSKTYIINNNTSYTATIAVSSSGSSTTPAGATLTIPAMSTATVYTDGTNFYPQNSYLPGAVSTGSNLTVNGALSSTSISNTGNESIGGNLTLTGNETIGGTLSVTGTTTLSAGGTSTTPSTGDSTTKIATTAFVTTALQAMYPVGSIYMNTSSSTNPGTLFGFGTWTALAPGQMLLGNGGGYTAGATGGSATTTIGLSNIPAHTHSITDPGHSHTSYSIDYAGGGGYNVAGNAYTGTLTGRTTSTATTGITINNTQSGGTAFPNTAMTTISPYLVVYMWQRTA